MCNNSSNYSNVTDCSTHPVGATIISPVLMFLAGVIGNILALCSLYKSHRDGRTSKFYNFITGLVWTDFLGIVVTSPSVILAYVNGLQWIGGDVHCRLHGFAMTCFGLATPLFICAMAVERFLALKCVFFYSNRCHTGTARACIVTFWFIVIVYGLMPLFGFGRISLQYPGTWCYLDFRSENILNKVYGYIYSCTNLTLISVIVFCNVYVVFVIVKTRSWRTKDRHKSDVTKTRSHMSPEVDGLVACKTARRKTGDVEVQMIVLLCALTIVFTICWAPLMIHIVLTLSTGNTERQWDLNAVRLASINQTLDPWLYILFRRSACLKLGQCVACIKTTCFRSLTPNNNPPNLVSIRNNLNCKTVYPYNRPEKNDNVRVGGCKSAGIESLEHPADVTNDVRDPVTKKNKRYICKLQIGQGDAQDAEERMCVKIFYMSSSSTSVSNKNSALEQTDNDWSSLDERRCMLQTLPPADVSGDVANVYT